MAKMDLKAVKVTMLTSNHGNRLGFSIVEASVSLFIAGTLLLAIIGFGSASLKYTKKLLNRADSYIEAQNDYSKESIRDAL